jgi:hypothetical protein
MDSDVPKLRIGHYSSGDGLIGLVLDRTGTPPLAKIDGDPEVLVLQPGAGFEDRRGVRWTPLRRDTDEVLLEVAQNGQVRYYAPGSTTAMPVHRDADGEPLSRTSSPNAAGLTARCAALTAEVANAVGTRVEISATAPGEGDRAAFEEAAENAAKALERVGDNNLGKRALRSLKALEVRMGESISVEVKGARAQVFIVPALGLAGRPSSARIQKVLEANL